MSPGPRDSLNLQTLTAKYASGEWTLTGVIAAAIARIEAYPDKAVWIDKLPPEHVEAQLARATERRARGEKLPLFGAPFAVKDNIDVAGRPTTAACAEYAYVPERSAPVVERLYAAGAILLGKTNLDQFAAGLVGVRSPFGVCGNAFDARYIPGGSSSGSAVAVATGLVSFALGTDTAGSGRVPAGFNNVVGLKPTRGRISTTGVVPACRSLDCVSVFALTCADAEAVADIAQAFDPACIYSRKPEELPRPRSLSAGGWRFGVAGKEDLRFFGNAEAAIQFHRAVERLRGLGGTPVTIDFSPFARTAQLLYSGPWLAERYAALKTFLEKKPDALLPVTRSILMPGKEIGAVAAFEGQYELRALCRRAEEEWAKMDVLLVPTSGTIYTIAEVQADPIRLNANLGYYTNFVNLMDLCALSIPSGFQPNGLPAGVTLVAPPGQEAILFELGDACHRASGVTLGATGAPLPPGSRPAVQMEAARTGVKLAVVGAHLSGQPLNSQLTDRNAALLRTCRTWPCYRLYSLPGTVPPKPGLVRVEEGGVEIEVEVWELTPEAFGSVVAAVPPPMVIGTIRLEDGEAVKSFLCEPHALHHARDISDFGGWRRFLAEG